MVDGGEPSRIAAVDSAIETRKSVLHALDNSSLSGFHWKAMITSGMGFFTDAYDLFIIGVVLAILTPLWHLSNFEISLVGSTSLIAAALGSMIFGRLADFVGRRSIYGFTLLVLAAGALASALAPNVLWLIIFRFILGLGIGGDYPLSATLMSEYANRRDRGKLVTMVFAMQGVGLILGPLVAIGLLLAGLDHDLTWRIMLALGAVPALATFYLRRQIAETPRFALMVQGDLETAAATISQVTGQNGHNSARPLTQSQTAGRGRSSHTEPIKTKTSKRSWLPLLGRPPYLLWLIGTAGAWFLLDIAYYGTTISSPLVLKALNAHSSLLLNMVYTLLIFLVAAFPGYIVAALTIDHLGRRWIQCVGFAMMALAYGLLAVFPSLTQLTAPFLLVYGVSYFFTEFGPNVTTFVYPAEIFPVMVRSTAHGIAAALGKVGAFIGALIFPFLLSSFHLPGVMTFTAIISVAGLVLTLLTLPEPSGRSLEEISGEYKLVEQEASVPSPLLTESVAVGELVSR
ncbi:MFS transporter [Thermogemmatispora sp.]|uniref:MFS transporter n=1 Tax=Thermogemmatispora sp. TaxID=1968838 RepID=UPI001DC5AFA3|nr:MFS transporter [Thermogemmatispora sp.]MBX5451528.1 MFS transporter [Thermogemmatispora sp.]